MNNLINYLKWRGDLSFDISPLNEVDALIFSELVYLDFSGYTEKSQLPLSDINKLYFKEKRDVVFKDYYVIKDFYNTVGKEITKLLSESAKSNRLKIYMYRILRHMTAKIIQCNSALALFILIQINYLSLTVAQTIRSTVGKRIV